MRQLKYSLAALCTIGLLVSGCSNDSETEPIKEESRNFSMGFTSWSFGPNLQDVDDTYAFITNNADVYVEHLDGAIPWNAYINDEALPIEFTNEISGKANRKITNKKLVLSVGVLNNNRDDLSEDFDGSIPSYTTLSDDSLINAYTSHVAYLVNRFSPDYLVIAREMNELWFRNQPLWSGFEIMINEVVTRTRATYPNLKIGTSVSLHNLYEPNVANSEEYLSTIWRIVNQMDFVGISYYPFLKNQNSPSEFQETLDFLHSNTNKPIAIVESGHIAEDLIVPNLNVSISGNPAEQNSFLETLLTNAQDQDYEMVVWWAHRDYDALWEVFPEEVKDIGQLWRDTGLLDENGVERLAWETWNNNYSE